MNNKYFYLLIIIILCVILTLLFTKNIYSSCSSKTTPSESIPTVSSLNIKQNDPNDLPVNRYPFIGSHNSSAYIQDNTNNIYLPLVACQYYNFLNQYTLGGCKYFDLRCKISPKNQLYFNHGNFDLQLLNEDISLFELLQKVIENNDFIVLCIIPTNASYNKVQILLDKYLKDKKLNNFVHYTYGDTQASITDLDKSINYYLNLRKNILITRSDNYTISNYYDTMNVQCIPKSKDLTTLTQVTSIINPCAESCIYDTNRVKLLYNYLNKTHMKYITNINTNNEDSKKLFILQGLWQSPNPDDYSQIYRTVTCFGLNTLIVQEIDSKINKSLYSFIITGLIEKSWQIPNVIIFDNVNSYTKQLRDSLLGYYKIKDLGYDKKTLYSLIPNSIP